MNFHSTVKKQRRLHDHMTVSLLSGLAYQMTENSETHDNSVGATLANKFIQSLNQKLKLNMVHIDLHKYKYTYEQKTSEKTKGRTT